MEEKTDYEREIEARFNKVVAKKAVADLKDEELIAKAPINRHERRAALAQLRLKRKAEAKSA